MCCSDSIRMNELSSLRRKFIRAVIHRQVMTMARTLSTPMLSHPQPRRRLPGFLIIFFFINLSYVFTLSTAPIRGRVTQGKSSLFPKKPSAGSGFEHKNVASTSYLSNIPVQLSNHLIRMNFRVPFFSISKICRHLKPMRRTILRTVAILSLALFGFSVNSPTALAAVGSKNTVATASKPSGSSVSSKFTKVVVATAAVAAGATTAHKIRIWNHNNEESSSKDTENSSPSPEPKKLTSTTSSAEVEKPTKELTISKKNNKTYPSPLVSDLDAKIERLREKELLAREAAEKARIEQIAQEEEARKRKEATAAEMAQVAREEAKRKAAEEKAERERISLEKERLRLEQVEHLQVLEEMKTEGGDENRRIRDIERARKQPKSLEEELLLKEKYGAMGLEDRAFNILVDLGMVDLHSDPGSLEWEDSDDDDIDSSNVFL